MPAAVTPMFCRMRQDRRLVSQELAKNSGLQLLSEACADCISRRRQFP